MLKRPRKGLLLKSPFVFAFWTLLLAIATKVWTQRRTTRLSYAAVEKVENFGIKDNAITNTIADSVTLFQNTNNGYVKFDGTFGLVLPVGTSTERPGVGYRETGMTRFNTEDQRVEVFDGINWVSVAGSQAGLTPADAEDLAIEKVLIFG